MVGKHAGRVYTGLSVVPADVLDIVDPESLDIGSTFHCVIGQGFNVGDELEWDNIVAELAKKNGWDDTDEFMSEHGFDIHCDTSIYSMGRTYYMLTRIWAYALRKRKENASN